MQGRALARRRAVQAVYQWQVAHEGLHEIERQFREDHGLGDAQEEYFCALLHGVPAQIDAIDAVINRYADRAVREIDPVERAILRIGVFELLQRVDVPYRVVINEAVNLAKEFGATHSHKFVNGIMDKAAREIRTAELPGGTLQRG